MMNGIEFSLRELHEMDEVHPSLLKCWLFLAILNSLVIIFYKVSKLIHVEMGRIGTHIKMKIICLNSYPTKIYFVLKALNLCSPFY